MARIKNFLTPQWLKEFEELKRQAASRKPQATKSQAASDKLLDNLSLIKFHVSRSEVLDHDKCVQRMFHMEGYLVWRKCHTITLGYF